MKNLDHQARSNVLKKIMSLMGDQMASRSPKDKADIKKEDLPKKDDEMEENCSYCDGEGCRRCK